MASSSIAPSMAAISGRDSGMGAAGMAHHGHGLFVGEAMIDPDRRPGEPLPVKMPSGLNSRSALTVYRVRPACRLARLLERISGSMGITRSGR